MVDVWYPAERASGPAAQYLDVAAFEQALGASGLREQLGSAYDAVKGGLVRTHAVVGAPFARSGKRNPVLIFSHGGGMTREFYTAQVEDLASHGYVSVAIAHTYDAMLSIFPDGRYVILAPQRWPTPTATSIKGFPPSHEANPDRLQWWADDIRFVLNELSRENRTGSSPLPFAGRLDLTRVGALGHSAGGQAAARACQIDGRLRACLNQDGETGFAPFYLDADGWGMDQAFLLMERAPETRPPTHQELAAMKLTLNQAREILARLKARQNSTLRSTGKGSYKIVFANDKTSHMDFSDLPILQARDRVERETRVRVLGAVRSYTRAFFDKALKGTKAPLLDERITNEFVAAVESFPPAKRPRARR